MIKINDLSPAILGKVQIFTFFGKKISKAVASITAHVFFVCPPGWHQSLHVGSCHQHINTECKYHETFAASDISVSLQLD